MQIKDSIALVTGANRGLGKAYVKALLNAGAKKVYAAARDIGSIEAAPGVVPLKLDVTKPEDIRAAIASANDVNLLINNAGINGRNGASAGNIDIDTLRLELETNAIGPLATSLAFAPILAANGGGAVVNMHSALSWVNLPNTITYSASKAAVWSLTNGLRLQLASQGTLVVGVHVAFVDTDMTRGLEGVPKADADEVVARVLSGIENNETEVLADGTAQAIKQNLSNGIYLRPVS
ncbi:SDR family oxidoreductase [Pseudomonas tolaasii]|uniref:SDR family oxidoreductase n=2 Tax=Pseudomonas tolaasii TaxID=29442 RepID=A0A7Y8AU64_PSETO|nr:SDR family oxidoreductase [Pseudomonas tolaasii]ARB27401.1 SDR family oxidoreductase [Pseudomonas tolaasii]KAB0467492.1 SDR family oxidoreductase [Pseudomonas tolaasii]MBW4791191.1 SDR family oxidoreductase [Pseudomonas tolaasii]MBY8943297.1 SDR family oxidoreductase [Pseudomonas tolaasii]NVZ48440.1 SDR family oxidoreductase [Pseudomonas tolaasii]